MEGNVQVKCLMLLFTKHIESFHRSRPKASTHINGDVASLNGTKVAYWLDSNEETNKRKRINKDDGEN